jgi:hypothetical protein
MRLNIVSDPGGSAPADPPTRSLAPRFAAALRSRALACARVSRLQGRRRQDSISSVVASSKETERVLPDRPVHRPLERFWPYADLSEQPTDEELAALHPELRTALFGAPALPFSISLEFPKFEGDRYPRALELARASDEYVEVVREGELRHRARFFPGERPLQLRDLYEIVSDIKGSDVLIDDQPLPFARELWLPLVWYLIR